MEQASYQDAVLGGKDFDLTFAGSAFPPLERLLTNMHTRSDGIGNFGNFSDPKMDELVDEFLATNDGPRATELYREIWGWRLENAGPHITLSTYARYNLMSDKVNGWGGNKGLDWFFQRVWLSE
jgi:ABC-type transport system substrate-binding protein